MEKSLNTSGLETVDETKEGKKKNKKEKKEKKVETKPLTFARRNWVRITWFLTWWIPSCCLSRCGKMKRADVRMAWREKVAICLLIFFSWCIILFMNIGLGLIFCPPIPSFKFTELSLAKGKSATAYMYGSTYDLAKLAKYSHGRGKLPEGVNEDELEPLQGNDITSLFPLPLRMYCPNLDISDRDYLNFAVDINYVERFDYSNIPFAKHNSDPIQGARISDDPYWFYEQTKSTLKSFRSGRVVYGQEVLQKYRDDRVSWGAIDGRVYDLSVYVNMTEHEPKPSWMPTEVVNLFKFGSSYDIKNGEMTNYWNELKLDAETKNNVKVCLDNVFYVGDVDPSETLKCRVTDILLLVFSGIALSVTAVKFLAALQLSSKRDPQDYDKFVILQVPCYTEGEESVRRTLESLATLQYKDQNKLIFVIADGMIIGGGNDLPTPRIVLNVLGVDPKLEPESFAFKNRYLTTLMLQQFPNYKMKFTPDATCRTVVPEKFEILLSQRRRWINSTIHNLFELLWLKDMCGFCCFSMRFVVMLDLVGTLILPASVIYLIYIIIAWSTKFQIINLYSILIMASIYILQGLLFIIKQKWEHIGWMIFYLFAIPLYNFYIPIYSYWHFDDFSWGNTRVVVGDGKKQIISEEAEPFDPESVPLMTWSEHEQKQWD
ncbi:glycosyltransferase family 2 protein, partial [Conidiobolus coronatus NRRL 28638]